MLLLLWSLPTDCPPTQQHQTVRFAPLHRQLGDVCFSAELAAYAGRKSGPRVFDDGFDDVFAYVGGLAWPAFPGFAAAFLADADRVCRRSVCGGAAPRRPRLRDEDVSLGLPRPDPHFLPPWSC